MFETVSEKFSGQRERLEEILGSHQYTQDTTGDDNPCEVPPEIALRVYDILQNIAARAEAGEFKHLGVSIAVGYQPENYAYVLPMDDDYFAERESTIYQPDIADQIAAAGGEFDGGITMDDDGNILEGGVMFTSNPKQVLEDMGIPNSRKLPVRFGFNEPVGTRHISAISASYRIPNALIFILSEETNTVRTFYRGKIISSPHAEEIVEPQSDVSGVYTLPTHPTSPAGDGLEAA